MNRAILFIWLLAPLCGFSQVAGESYLPERTDSVANLDSYSDTLAGMLTDSVLGYEEYLYWVEKYHPVAQSSGAVVDLAGMKLRASRSGFDPLLYGNFDRKVYDDTDYYEKLKAGIEIPTWMGLSVMAGYEDNAGEYLNPERNVPTAGLLNAGIKANVGAGLLMDNRRAALQQAKIGVEQSQNKQLLMLNDLFFEATQAYFQWAFADRSLSVAEEALDLASVRYEGVRQSYFLGDVPAIDTVEAYTQVLNRLYQLRGAQNTWIDAVNTASVYLWEDQLTPIDIPPFVRPGLEDQEVSFQDVPLQINQSHPKLKNLQFEKSQLDIERRLQQQNILPTVELKYNVLSENVSPAPIDDYFDDTRFLDNNYKLGARVAFPIFTRDARGKMGMAKVQINLRELEMENTREQLRAKLDATLQKLSNVRDQIEFYTQNVNYLSRLLEGENELFSLGESSLFLVNSRETKLVEAQNILYSLQAKERMLAAEARVIGGLGFFE